MNTVQNGGVSNPPQTDIKKPPVQIRTISDYGPFKIYHEKSVDEHLFRQILVPGSFHYCQGDAKTGKTHLCVTLMYLLSTGFDKCGEWEIITNIFFYHVDKDNIEVNTPERIHHIDSIEELFEAILEQAGKGRNVAIFLDDIDRFYLEKPNQLTQCLDSLVQNRNKLGLLLFFSDGSEVHDYLQMPRSKYPCDCEWQRHTSQ